jgi:hypothetical protein
VEEEDDVNYEYGDGKVKEKMKTTNKKKPLGRGNLGVFPVKAALPPRHAAMEVYHILIFYSMFHNSISFIL